MKKKVCIGKTTMSQEDEVVLCKETFSQRRVLACSGAAFGVSLLFIAMVSMSQESTSQGSCTSSPSTCDGQSVLLTCQMTVKPYTDTNLRFMEMYANAHALFMNDDTHSSCEPGPEDVSTSYILDYSIVAYQAGDSVFMDLLELFPFITELARHSYQWNSYAGTVETLKLYTVMPDLFKHPNVTAFVNRAYNKNFTSYMDFTFQTWIDVVFNTIAAAGYRGLKFDDLLDLNVTFTASTRAAIQEHSLDHTVDDCYCGATSPVDTSSWNNFSAKFYSGFDVKTYLYECDSLDHTYADLQLVECVVNATKNYNYNTFTELSNDPANTTVQHWAFNTLSTEKRGDCAQRSE